MGREMKKYKFTGETKNIDGIILHRIKRLSDGKIGGWIEKEENLSHEGKCWVDEEAKVFGDAFVFEDAQVFGNAKVYGNAKVFGKANIYDNASVFGDAWVYGYAKVYGNAKIFVNANVYGKVRIYGDAKIYGRTNIYGNAQVFGNANVYGEAQVSIDKIKENCINIIGLKYNITILPNYIRIGYLTKTKKEWAKIKYDDISEYISKKEFKELKKILKPFLQGNLAESP